MIDFKKNWGKLALFVLLLVGTIVLIIIQVNTSQTSTKLESSLINILQFLLSVGFTWFLSLVVFEFGYKEKQKKFAIAAFRRIKEIQRNVKRTHNYIKGSLISDNDVFGCLKVVQANLTNAQDTINSSINDWADIIEDEIEISSEIEKLEAQQVSSVDKETIKKDNEERMNNLLKKLPATLRRELKKEKSREELVNQAVAFLRKKMRQNGHLDLEAFWELGDGFMKKPDKLKEGDEVHVARGLTHRRSGAILVYDNEGNSIGVVTNRCIAAEADYDVFSDAMDIIFDRKLLPKLFGGNPVIAKITKVVEYDPKFKRKYYELIIEKRLRKTITQK